MSATTESSALLDRYVPRIATGWDVDAPGRRWQELDATLCFVDISGFTNLSEKLSRRGRIGAEELTSVLNYVFGRMLELAYLQGGSLLKFGGDALLLMYTGYDHASRAASAAVEMRSALRAAAEYQTSVGRLRLRMSVGIHSGPIHLFRVGSLHQELVVAGHGGTTTTVMEKSAGPGEILVSDGTRRRLADDAIGRAKGPGWLLRWRTAHCIAPGPTVRDPRDPDALGPWIPTGLRDYLRAGEAEPEHRIVTVGFVRFCGVDEMIAREGPEHAADAIDSAMVLIQSAADDEGVTFLGSDINEDGAKVILVAGAPVAREGDEGRILRAVRRVADAATVLDLHVGINRGHVFTGEVGTEFRSTYTVMGDTVNLAARLMAAAPAGSIYATPGVLDHSGTLFAATGLEPLRVKGKDEPVKAYAVGDELGDRSTDERDELPFVGRESELGTLQAVIAAAIDEAGSVVTLTGEAGFGKSRLVREALGAVPDLPVITIRAEPYGSTTPYRPWRDPIRALLGIERAANDQMAEDLESAIAAVASDLLPLLPLIARVAHIDIPDTPEVAAIEPRFRQARLTSAVVSLLDRLAPHSMVLDVEDAQWMDEASASLLSRITGRTDRRPWAVVVTRRSETGGFVPDTTAVIEVGELPPEEAERLITTATQATPLHPHEVKAISARTGGNPLFIGEMLRIVRETGSTDELPDSIGTLVSTTIDALPPLARRVLRYTSVLGRSFRISTAREVLADDALRLDAATRVLLRDFLEESGTGVLRFRTAMVRDVAYDGLSYRRREQLHRRAARAIAATTEGRPEEAADQLAMHYSLGNDHENTWHYARIAADRAMHAYANAEAASQLERAIVAARRLPGVTDQDRSAVWAFLGDVRESAGLFDSALEAYRHSYRLADDDPVARADLLLRRASVRERAGAYSIALREATEARKLVAISDDPRAASRVDANAAAFQAVVRLRQGRIADALVRAREAIEEAELGDEKAAVARAYGVIAGAHMMRNDADAFELCRRSLTLYEELGDLIGQNHMNNNLGVLAYFDGRWDEALDYYRRSRDGAERVGNIVDAAFSEANMGELLVNQGRYEEAEPRLTNTKRVLRSTGELSMAMFAELQLARIHIERGEFDEAESLLREIESESRASGFTANTLEAALHLADCSIRRGDGERALGRLDLAMTEAGEEAEMFTLTEQRLRAVASAEAGRTEEALAILGESLAVARSRDQRYDEALILAATAGILEPDDPAASDFAAEAAGIMAALGIQT